MTIGDEAKLSPFDPAGYLTCETAIQENLIAAAEEGDPAALESVRRDVARARLAKASDLDENGT